MKHLTNLPPLVFVLAAAIFEVVGDGLIRKGIMDGYGSERIGYFAVSLAFLFLYGITINLAPVQFGKIIGLYIAILFIFWQVGNLILFKTPPRAPIVVGGFFIILGGLIVTFWKG